MAGILKIRKVLTLPQTFEASTLYLVKSGDANHFDIYLSTDDGSSARNLLTKPEVQQMIVDAIAGFSELQVVANIAARDALTPTRNVQVLVLDATDDNTVASGSATYIYDTGTTAWYKISEHESMDVILQWNSIQGRPTSTVAAIDDAVSKVHVHANKPVIDALSDVAGHLYYNSQPIRSFLEEESW